MVRLMLLAVVGVDDVAQRLDVVGDVLVPVLALDGRRTPVPSSRIEKLTVSGWTPLKRVAEPTWPSVMRVL